ncbi:hypothetical protein A0H81_05044 [Grifola frondosa]|uniref:Uncharacterized protein n=1 Tax=Grifola frondosa TaxID=5627 RepID=A0A1C7MD31_GRIFR|nr:hypothetical protein A0H81_05044 [Grifola frondosa]
MPQWSAFGVPRVRSILAMRTVFVLVCRLSKSSRLLPLDFLHIAMRMKSCAEIYGIGAEVTGAGMPTCVARVLHDEDPEDYSQ